MATSSLFVVIATLVLCVVEICGQTCVKDAIIEDPPANTNLRTLCDRLRILFSEGDSSYGPLYDVLYEKPPGGRQAYIHYRQENADSDQVRSFVPFKLVGGYDGAIPQYSIQGCVTVKDGSKHSHTYTEIVIAHWVNSDWYFSFFGEPVENEKCHRPI